MTGIEAIALDVLRREPCSPSLESSEARRFVRLEAARGPLAVPAAEEFYTNMIIEPLPE
jgi:hypothetical protein